MPDEVVVIVQNRPFYGAMLVHLPLLAGLRRRFPGARIVAACNFPIGAVLLETGGADEVLAYRGAFSLWRSLCDRDIACLVSLRPRSGGLNLAVGLSGARRRLGYRAGLSAWCYDIRIPRDTGIYRALAYNAFLPQLDPQATVDDCATPFRRLAASSDWQPPSAERLVTIIPCGGEDRKNWGIAHFLELLTALADDDPTMQFACVLGEREAPFRSAIAEHPLAERITVLQSLPVADLARLVEASALCIANDCGPGHIGQMSGTPHLSLFGNWDGAANTRIAEWFLRRPGSCCLTTAATATLGELPLAPVLDAARGLLAEPQRPSEVRHV